MAVFIDNYKGCYKNINYYWKTEENTALLCFVINGKKITKSIGNLAGSPIEEDFIKMISEMEMEQCLSQIENEKHLLDVLEENK